MISIRLQCLMLFASVIVTSFGKKHERLEPFHVDPELVTVAGFSSGGAQAMQLHIAHSSLFHGAGIFSGVPYMYGYDRQREDFIVNDPDAFNVSLATHLARLYESQGLIDNLEGLNKSKVYIFHGTKDSTVYHGSGKAIEKIYSNFTSNIFAHLDTMLAEHGMPSDNSGGPCGMLNYFHYLVNNCNYNGPFNMFNHLYGGGLLQPNGSVGTVPLQGRFYAFDQSEFLGKKDLLGMGSSMDDVGYAYLPSGCMKEAGFLSSGRNSSETPENKPCKLSLILHGCAQGRETYGEHFPRSTGFLEVAELNDIVLLFPQTRRSLFRPRNPSGCWDWMGFTGKDFGNKKGIQIQALYKLLQRAVVGVGPEASQRGREETR